MAARQTYHHDDLESAAVTASLETIAESGVDALTLRGVATRTGVTHPALYRYFSDRAALLRAVAERCHTELRVHLVRAVEHGDDDPLARIRRLARAFGRWAAEHPEFFQVMAARATHPDGDGDGGGRAGVPAGIPSTCTCAGCLNMGLLLAEVVRGQALGVLVDGPPRELAVVLWSFVAGYVLSQLQGRGGYAGSSVSGMLRHMDLCLSLVLDGVRSESPRSSIPQRSRRRARPKRRGTK